MTSVNYIGQRKNEWGFMHFCEVHAKLSLEKSIDYGEMNQMALYIF